MVEDTANSQGSVSADTARKREGEHAKTKFGEAGELGGMERWSLAYCILHLAVTCGSVGTEADN